MKILHTADIHLGELTGPIRDGENARMQDTIKCMNYLTKQALKEDVDVILIAGDLFHRSRLWADEMLREITIASDWLKNLVSIAPVVLMWGTGNHDSIAAFENIKKMDIPDLTVVTEPDLLEIETKVGKIQIAAVPGVDKGFFRERFPGLDAEDENKAISEALGNVILGISADADPELPLILMSHYTVTGCELENGEQIFMNSDIVIPTSALAASNYDLVCLGHIHKAQSVPNCSRPVYYSGPLNGITFNEEGQSKGFWIHDITFSDLYGYGPSYKDSKFIMTPSREFLTLNWSQKDLEYYEKNGIELSLETLIRDAIVRVIYSCDDELNKRISRKSLEQALYNAGAFYVSEIRPSQILATVEKSAMSENDSVENNLRFWLEKQEMKPEGINKVVEIAKSMISEVSASLPTGKLSGVFEPLRLEVKNYRSYLEEEFDFTKVSFATVNGPNGIGKSSFFMDAIADCLYEEPREGELTGWISNGDDIKSGAITFEFLMGADKWRVVRTRAKSGKTTLALQRFVEEQWKDFSGERKDQTQEKILNLLGMDALTFKSCALIMQDNYGVFLEADKTERMQVLGNILGLGVYDKLHDLAKEELRLQNRKVAVLKEHIENLDGQLFSKGLIERQLNEYLDEKKSLMKTLEAFENDVEAVKKMLEVTKEKKSEIRHITDKVMALVNEVEAKEQEKKDLIASMERAQNIVDQEDKILAKIAEYEQTKDKITELKAKMPLVRQKETDLFEAKNEHGRISHEKNNIQIEIARMQASLGVKEQLKNETECLDELEVKLSFMDKSENELRDLVWLQVQTINKLTNARKDYNSRVSRIESEIESCEKKAALIENSKCPIENPTCNFLKDALKAKGKINALMAEKEQCDKTEIQTLEAELNDIEDKIKSFNYDDGIHKDLKIKIVALRKKKEQLLSLSGQEELLKNYLSQRAELGKKLEIISSKIELLSSELQALKDEVKDLSRLEGMLEALGKWYKGKEELPAAKQFLESSNTRIETLHKEITSRSTEIKTLETKRDQLCDEVASTDYEVTIHELENDIRHYNTELRSKMVAIGIAESKLVELKVLEQEYHNKLLESKEEADQAVKLTSLVKAFSIDGIPFQIVRSVVSELSNQSNEILSQMTGGKMAIEMKTEKVLKNKNEVNALEIWISDYQRGTMPYLSRSGGQKVKAALSVAFALADLKASRAGIQLGMMFIDEPPFLDKEGVQAYCDALETIHDRYANMRMLSISHDPTFKSRFPQVIEVIDAGDKGSKIIFNQ